MVVTVPLFRMVLPPTLVLRLLAYKAPLNVVLPVLLSWVSPRRFASLPRFWLKVMSPAPVETAKVWLAAAVMLPSTRTLPLPVVVSCVLAPRMSSSPMV